MTNVMLFDGTNVMRNGNWDDDADDFVEDNDDDNTDRDDEDNADHDSDDDNVAEDK